MTPDRLQQIQELYNSVREASPDDRKALLDRADPELRSQVESLMKRQNDCVILDGPAPIPGDSTMTMLSTTLSSGDRLGPYQVESKLGEGGMGEVFRAVDTRLGRAVAIKTTHEQLNARFEREARVISSLNHPNICTLFDVGPNYLVMELVEGETIAARLKQGPMPVETVCQYGLQIAAALVEAHSKGVIHRDLKPGNVMIAKSGVKVLDFGLAKSGQDDSLTASNAVMGTPAYMSPEQREGKAADARSDIYSFGCLLYEMSTGSRVAPQRRRIPSPQLDRVVTQCLKEDPVLRWQSAADLERELTSVPASAVPWKAASAAAVILAVALAGYAYVHCALKLTDKDTIVLADFENKTGDLVFDDTLRQGLSVALQQSPFLSLIPDTQIQRTLALMGQPKDARLTPEIAEQICDRIGSAAVLEGSIASLGSQYILGLRAKNCNTGTILDQEQIQAARREDVLSSLSQIARKFRTRVGESLAAVEQHSTPLVEATTPSLEALKAYSTAVKVNISSGNAAAIPFMRRAVEIDPGFAMAYANLGLNYSNVGESALAAESSTKAWQLRSRTSDRERFFIEFDYDRQVTGNLERAFQTLEVWAQTYPRSAEPNPQDLLGGLSAMGTGRFERSIEQGKKTIAAEPDVVFGYTSLAQGNFYLDHFAEAENALRQLSARKLEVPEFLVYEYNLAFLQGNKEQMDRVAARANGKLRVEDWVANAEALVLASSGRLQLARRSSGRAVDLARRARQREAEATYQGVRAVWEAFYGNTPEGRRNATAALALSNGRDVKYAAALALAVCGDLTRSEAISDELEKRFPDDTFVQFTYVPVLRALSALRRGEPNESVERLQLALRYELAVNGLTFRLYMGGLHSAYVRGEALLALHRYPEAAKEFQKIVDHRGIAGADPIGALAHVQLARALALSGDAAKAKAAYHDFLTLWKDADPDIPILRSAKAEHSRLN